MGAHASVCSWASVHAKSDITGHNLVRCAHVQELRKQTQRCPICRNPVESLLHIRLGNKAATAPPAGKAAAAAPTTTGPAPINTAV